MLYTFSKLLRQRLFPLKWAMDEEGRWLFLFKLEFLSSACSLKIWLIGYFVIGLTKEWRDYWIKHEQQRENKNAGAVKGI